MLLAVSPRGKEVVGECAGGAAAGVGRRAARAERVRGEMARRTMQMVGVVLAAAVLGASAYNRPAASKDFKDLDMDESGHVDRAEVDAHLDRQFDVRP